MSQTLTNLAVATLAAALDKLEALFEEYADSLNHVLADWRDPSAKPETIDSNRPSDLLRTLGTIALVKITLIKIIRTRPATLPPPFIDKPDSAPMIADALIKLGDAVSVDEHDDAVHLLAHYLKGTTWDIEHPVETSKTETEVDELGSTNDLGEVTPGPAEPG